MKQKILILGLRWHILRSYCFVAEVTFKVMLPMFRPHKLILGIFVIQGLHILTRLKPCNERVPFQLPYGR